MANRLANATSPYLLQHKDNPVDWREWGDDAFAEARRRDVPVLLSVGYAACHWCHVMAHESFEDEEIAGYLNDHFVPVKVDREERPDVDAIYMAATVAMTGQGGWPMTCALTPAGEPFFAGTYFPPQPRQGMPGFRQLLEALVDAWTQRRDEVARVGTDLANHLRAGLRSGGKPPVGGQAGDVGALAVSALQRDLDAVNGGFGGAPKFPPSMVCEFLVRRWARLGDKEALQMAAQTYEAMARGGIYDQLGGGFARYSVDARWAVPHFEKMLYDNALLLRGYLHWWRLDRSPLAERVVRETADFLIAELQTAEGGFASSLDADSEGVEGKFYLWTPDQLEAALGTGDAAFAAAVFGVGPGGNAEGGASTLRLPSDPADSDRFAAIRARLLQTRAGRVRPGRDDKVVAAWNGLVISALAEAAVLFDEARWLDAAERAGRLLLDVHLDDDGRLRRVSRDGVAGEPAGTLEDYSCVADALLVLFGVTGKARWYDAAAALLDRILTHFPDGNGGFYDTADDAPALLARPQDPADNATPSGQSATAGVLITMAALTGDHRFRAAADALLEGLAGLAAQAPRFAGHTLSVLEAVADGPRQVAVVGRPDDPACTDLLRSALGLTTPGAVLAVGDGQTATVPLLADRPLIDGRPTAYVCQDFVCDLPVTDPADLRP